MADLHPIYETDEAVFGKQDEDGQARRPDKPPFILSQELWREPKPPKGKKKPDVIEATYDETWSKMRTEALHGRKCFYYKVWNATKGHEYTVELFEGIRREPCASCTCVATVVCKHIIECLMDCLYDRDPSFGEAEDTTDFMVGVRAHLRE